MCQEIGILDAQSLFDSIPANLRIGGLKLPTATPERQLVSELYRTLQQNRTYHKMPIFLGGGLKPQLVPASVKAVIHRQELINAYTPYQPEVSQGLLQCLFEYQSLMADITGMEVVNSSMYDGHTALGEAGLMATRVTKRHRFLVPRALNWEKRSVLENYTKGAGITIEAYAYDDVTGEVDVADLQRRLSDDVSGVYLENPNAFGIFEVQAKAIGAMAKSAGALFVIGVDPTTLGVVTPPGQLGADIVVGEASCFGGAPAAGGPLLGLFGTTEALVRKMPGRLIGATLDANQKRGYVMTLQAREQHIRRSKATSNICSNEALIANQAAMHLTLLGRKGLRDMGLQNIEAGTRLENILLRAGLKKRFSGFHYNEIMTNTQPGLHAALLECGVHAGMDMGAHHPNLGACTLWGSSPVHGDYEYDALAAALAEAIS